MYINFYAGVNTTEFCQDFYLSVLFTHAYLCCDSAEETITVCTAQNNDFHFSTKPKSSPTMARAWKFTWAIVAAFVTKTYIRDFKIPQQSTTEDELKCAAKHAEEWVDYDKNGAKCVSFKHRYRRHRLLTYT